MRSTVAWVVLVVAAGCSSSVHVAQPVGAAGGAVAAPNGTGVSIPPGALGSDLTISVTSAADAATPGGVDAVGEPYLFGPEGTQFLLPVTVTLKVDSGKLPSGKSLSDVVVYTAPAGTKQFVALVTTVTDATHVSAQTTHFSILVPGVPHGSTDCRVICGGGAKTDTCMAGTSCPPPTTSVACAASCMGHQYDVSCTGTACVCTKDGAVSGNATLSGSDGFAAYQTGCGFPGELPCDFSCSAANATTKTGDGTTAPATATSSCSCFGTCKGVYYMLACDAGSCSCGGGNVDAGTDTGTPKPVSLGFSIDSFSLSCDTDTTALEASWVKDCNFPGVVAPPSYGGPTGTGADGGVSANDGGTKTTDDGGTSAPLDMSTNTGDLACQHMFMTGASGCGIQENCAPHSYMMMCNGTTCMCMSDAGPGPTVQQGSACGSAVSADALFTGGCGYP